MSSILKALQKLETTRTKQAKGRRLTGSPASRSPWPWRMVSIYLASFFVIIAGGFFLLNRPLKGLKSLPAINDTKKTETRVPGPAVRSDPVGKIIPVPHMGKQTIQDDIKLEKQGPMDPVKQAAPATGIQITRHASPPASSDSVKQVKPAHTGKPAAQNKETDKPAPLAARQVKEISSTPDLPLIDSSILKLQAISWSPTPKDRMTVINNRILREKSIIDGYAVILIDQDSVLLQKNTEKGRLVFK